MQLGGIVLYYRDRPRLLSIAGLSHFNERTRSKGLESNPPLSEPRFCRDSRGLAGVLGLMYVFGKGQKPHHTETAVWRLLLESILLTASKQGGQRVRPPRPCTYTRSRRPGIPLDLPAFPWLMHLYRKVGKPHHV